jgi:DNA-binding PadR family transcriptional regulator
MSASEVPVVSTDLRGHLDLLLLGTLERLGEAHGYALIGALREASGGLFDPAEGTTYPALHRLERGGAVISTEDPGSGRGRRIYRITPAGRVLLHERRRQWRAFARATQRVLARGHPVAPDDPESILEETLNPRDLRT